jgi:hypothetical protein
MIGQARFHCWRHPERSVNSIEVEPSDEQLDGGLQMGFALKESERQSRESTRVGANAQIRSSRLEKLKSFSTTGPVTASGILRTNLALLYQSGESCSKVEYCLISLNGRALVRMVQSCSISRSMRWAIVSISLSRIRVRTLGAEPSIFNALLNASRSWGSAGSATIPVSWNF